MTLFSSASSTTEHKSEECQQNRFNIATWEEGKATGAKELLEGERPLVTGRLSLESSPGERELLKDGGEREGEAGEAAYPHRRQNKGRPHLHRVSELVLRTPAPCVLLALRATFSLYLQELASKLPCNFSLIVPPRPEPPAGFKCLKGRNQGGHFIYNFLQGWAAKEHLYNAF